MRTIGTVTRLQIQRSTLKTGDKPNRVYDPTPLLSVPILRVSPDGVLGGGSGGAWIVDVHHQAHPHTKNEDGLHGVSLGFTSHYAAMRERFGERLTVGCAGENIIAAADRTGASGCGSRCSRWRTRAGRSQDGHSENKSHRKC